MQFGLKENIIENIKNILFGFPQVESVIIYGSRAKGNYQPGSDIDLRLKENQLDLKILNKISLEFDDLLLPYTFDLSIFHQIDNEDLIDHINRVGKIFYERKSVEAHKNILLKHLLDRTMKPILFFILLFLSTRLFAQTIINRDPEIEQMVKEVSPDSLQSYINTLVAFGTRNTLSTQTDPKRGIGAARNWVLKKFNEFAKNSVED